MTLTMKILWPSLKRLGRFITRPVEKIADREQAIQRALATTSKPEDAVIIAGKELTATKSSMG